MPNPARSPTTLAIDAAPRDALGAVARNTHRDRDAVLTGASDAYLDVQR